MGWGLRIKEIAYNGGSLKNPLLLSHKKAIYRGDCLKMEYLDSLQKKGSLLLRGLIPKCML